MFYVYIGPPSMISNVSSEICINDRLISWSVASDLMACGMVSYILTISPDGMMMNTTDASHKFDGLMPSTTYSFSIEPRNMAGSGQIYNETLETAPESKFQYVLKLLRIWRVYVFQYAYQY